MPVPAQNMQDPGMPPAPYPTLVPYLMVFLITWVAAAGTVWWVGNGNLFLFTFQNGNAATDWFFNILTYLGDGAVFAAIAVIISLMDWQAHKKQTHVHGYNGQPGTPWYIRPLSLWVAFAISAVVTQGLKRLVFPQWVRPKAFFNDASGVILRQPDGWPMYAGNSFPSGHTLTAFCLCGLLAFLFPHPRLQIILLVVAWVVALSRVAVGQHFPLDVVAGAALGTVCTLLVRNMFFPRPVLYYNKKSNIIAPGE